MKNSLLLISVLSIICINGKTSYGEQYWAKSFGGNDNDCAHSIQQTSDGGYIVAGYTSSGNDTNVFVLKLDISGAVSWQKKYETESIKRAIAYSIQQTSDGGYIVAGITRDGDDEIFVLKLDSSGAVSWQKTYESIKGVNTNFIQQTSDGGYILVGYLFSTIGNDGYCFVLKIDSTGTVIWENVYVIGDLSEPGTIKQTTDEGYILATRAASYDDSIEGLLVLKLDNSGNVTWQKIYGGELGRPYSIHQTTDGGYILASSTSSFGAGGLDAVALKLDGNGVVTWVKAYGNSGGDYASSIHQTTDGGYILAGGTGGDFNGFLILKLDSSGNITWQKIYSGGLGQRYSIQQTTDGGYVLANYTSSFGADSKNVLVLKLDSSGVVPDCPLIESGNAVVTDGSVITQDSHATVQATSVSMIDNNVVPLNSLGIISFVCCYGEEDSDGDVVVDSCDNCPNDYNDNQEDNDSDGTGDVCDICPHDSENDIDNDSVCGEIDNCPQNANPEQEDTYPPQGNEIGDTCDCEGDFDCDGDCDGWDAVSFKADFGRNNFDNACEGDDPCNGDFDCDGDCDGTDAALFKEDFGRASFNNPCPSCEVGDWCVYPLP
jgi:hypothetical protein